MRKEILLAIIAGGGFGLLIAFGVWKLNTNLHSSPVKVDNSTSTPTDITGSPSPSAQTQTGQLKVVLVRPDNLAVFTDSQTNVTGATKQNVFVVVSGVDNDDITNSSDSGSFTSNVTLEAGTNQITATAFDSNGDEADTNLILVYSSQFVPDTNSASVAYLGTVTDISDSVIQIKDAAGNIEQIKATVDAHFIDTRASLNKEIKSTDIAIGDYLVALGVKG